MERNVYQNLSTMSIIIVDIGEGSMYLIWKTWGTNPTYGNTLFIRLGKTGWKYLSLSPVKNIPHRTRKKVRWKDREFSKDEWRSWFPYLSLDYSYFFNGSSSLHKDTGSLKKISDSLKRRNRLWSYIWFLLDLCAGT